MSIFHQMAAQILVSPEVCPNARAKNEKLEVRKYQVEIVWRNVVLFVLLHIAALYGGFLYILVAKWPTVCLAFFLHISTGLSITAGCHRLWSHRAYKAKWPLRAFLCLLNCIALQNDIYEWSRDHRLHHAYSETDADPHNATRGFFFSHMGWLMCKKHPEVIAKGKKVDCSDILHDPIVRFQRRYYIWLSLVFCFLLPTIIPKLFWNEEVCNAFFVCVAARYCLALHFTWLVNSAAHMFGNRPFDKNISPRENLIVSFLAIGEGFHNYHHTFPYDYSTSEYGCKLNLTTLFIDLMVLIGWAYDCKTASRSIVEDRAKRTGDGSHVSVKGH